mmetsp:Transcript_13733/g.26607  ORF Transcript_13733/g.26607 Transcript_13733/m.26607 type:complete len:217 (-) Transcript_13733:327-977(-)|eukprot:CAMPEP_0171484674 /NCGR_PEP_ID=MMETSP0958-20121227/132_1 /TAXON_ID=87120 /ORGANISM="Aurantiochytrium limacinum, Strain ATCCMYA-1381" /LENGTH=216 /DNA_ID=CAMNT_0012017401 /DNA_START=190 /DNA_END=840 /DNA_ORIENTATION=-
MSFAGRSAFGVGAMISRSLRERPIATNFVLSGLLGLASDCICQFGVERKTWETLDYNRLWGMGSFAATYSMVKLRVYPLYGMVMPTFLKATAFRQGIASSLLDGLVHSPILYLPYYYVYTGLWQGNMPSQSIETYKEQFVPVMKSLISIWVPVQAVNFALVPPTHRILFVCVCNLVWNGVLDYQSHSLAHHTEDIISHHEVITHHETAPTAGAVIA